ncbi:MAG: hypothetical protein IPL79_03410 [Myxococcales bacterium]|nr:hypothetical protein [Myxococcales bacterium]
MKRFPPGETVYIGVGRSPSSVMAYLKAAGGGGDDDDFGAVDFPVSGLGHNGSRQSTIDASWPAYQELFREFLPVKQVKGAKRLLLIDLTSGVSTENFRYAVRRFLHEEGINGIEIETFSLVATAAKGEPNTVASPFVFRGARVDHVVTHGVNGYAFGKENVAVFATGNVAGANTPTRLRQLVNPDRVILEAAIRENLGADAEWLKFLEQVFPHLLDPAAAEAQAKPVVAAPQPAVAANPATKVKFHKFAGRGQPDAGRKMAWVDPETNQAYDYLSRAEYEELRDLSLLLPKTYAPKKAYFLGVGRSVAAPAAFLARLGENVAGYLPIDGLSTYVERGKPLSANDLKAFNETFDAFIPAEALEGNRDVVLFQKISSGGSLLLLKPVVEAWLKSKGRTNKVLIAGITEAAGQQAGFDALLLSTTKTLQELGTRKYNGIAPYGKFRPGSSKNTDADTPYDLQSKQAKPTSVEYKTFAAELGKRMVNDPALVTLKF